MLAETPKCHRQLGEGWVERPFRLLLICFGRGVGWWEGGLAWLVGRSGMWVRLGCRNGNGGGV